jgi:hypothetical protein
MFVSKLAVFMRRSGVPLGLFDDLTKSTSFAEAATGHRQYCVNFP